MSTTPAGRAFLDLTDERGATSSDGAEIRSAIAVAIDTTMEPWLRHPALRSSSSFDQARDQLIEQAVGDLRALTHRDPAAGGCWRYVLQSYRCYRAVLNFRIAHAFVTEAQSSETTVAPGLQALAREVSEYSKVLTGIEIHPAATIGSRFVIDHGFGTVIGESAAIGSDCYLLQGVILGSTGIAHNPSGKRHPTLGDRVEVAAFARILGPVLIGSDVVIGPHAVITQHVPSSSRVLVVNQYQVVNGTTGFYILGVIPRHPGAFDLAGYGLDRPDLRVTFVDSHHLPLPDVEVDVVSRTPDRLSCRLRGAPGPFAGSAWFLKVTGDDGASVTIVPPGGIETTLRKTMFPQCFEPGPSLSRPLDCEANQ